eukprot:GHVN01080753.1.p1 GENE.GHVN01080753.1~~GHVN01080753.1.p1  ORF type:complete len:689 (+),score=110.00 GHVN01080753.1:40-2067(+)
MTDTVEVMTQPNPDVRPTTNDASHSSSSYKALHPASTDNSMPRRHSTKRLDIDEVKAMLLAREKSEKESDVRRAVSEISSCSPATIKFTDLILDVQVQDVAQQKGPAIIRRIKTGVCGGTTTTRRILHGINGVIEPGDCVALMGASGAGKTTLLNVLAGRIGGWSGLVKVNNKVLKRDAFNAVSCFIQQEDLFNGYLTVGEQLNFMARMRVKDDAVRAERLKRLIKGLNLTHRLNARIGNMQQQAKSEISGGEKKRVSIATQLLTNPSIIFADEPTSGLDSPIAVSVCEILNFLAYSGRTVITTIHQPSTAVFEMFNKVLLLSEGRMIYFGDRLGAVAWFSRLGGSYTVPTHSNPADHLIEALAIKPDEKATKLIEIQGLAEKWMNERVIFLEEWEREGKIEFVSEALNETGGVGATIARSASYIGGSVAPTRDASGDKDLVIIPEPPVSWCVQLGYLFYRCMRVNMRTPVYIPIRLMQSTIFALLGGLVYFRVEDQYWQSRTGGIFYLVTIAGMSQVLAAISTFVTEKPVALREITGGAYSPTAYYTAKVLADIPGYVFFPIWFISSVTDKYDFLAPTWFTWLTPLNSLAQFTVIQPHSLTSTTSVDSAVYFPQHLLVLGGSQRFSSCFLFSDGLHRSFCYLLRPLGVLSVCSCPQPGCWHHFEHSCDLTFYLV